MGIEATPLPKKATGILGKALALPRFVLAVRKASKRYRPDFIMGIADMYGAWAAKLLSGAKGIIWTDTEHAKLQIKLGWSAAWRVITPECWPTDAADAGRKHIRYAGYHELAYLHPSRFEPDDAIYGELGLEPDQPFAILRFISWDAEHDRGITGLSDEEKLALVKRIEPTHKVFITSEKKLPPELDPYRIAIPLHRVHHALYHADFFIAESGTMCSECSVLGTHSVFLNPLPLCYLHDQERRWGIVRCFQQREEWMEKVHGVLDDWLADPELKSKGKSIQQTILDVHVDVTDWMIQTIESLARERGIE